MPIPSDGPPASSDAPASLPSPLAPASPRPSDCATPPAPIRGESPDRGWRWEHDSLGPVAVPADAPWGAQTQRALRHFDISTERPPVALLHALLRLKRAAAWVNAELGLLPADLARAVVQAADALLAEAPGSGAATGAADSAGTLWPAFPLSLWQSGSGTQTHMNLNEVLARRASALLAPHPLGTAAMPPAVHAHDHVNLGQSTNDVIPSAIHLALALGLDQHLLPTLQRLQATLQAKAQAYAGIAKIGRTHLQDAVPLTLGHEISAWCAQLALARRTLQASREGLHALALGGTAVGTGLNSHPRFAGLVIARLAEETGLPLVPADNRFAALAGHEPVVVAHAALKTLAVALTKIANDIRWLASGPRCGLGELRIPQNEPGSSIMPGKVNPSQCEALLMVCCQVLGNDTTLGMAAASGHFQLNVQQPLIAHLALQSLRLLADAMRSFELHCARGIEPDLPRLTAGLQNSLMLATALTPHIGYDRAAAIARYAHLHGLGLREAALRIGGLSAAQFDAWVQPLGLARAATDAD